MALENFNKTIWIANILENLQKSLVFGARANRDFEGEINSKGDRVRINQISDINVNDYADDTDITVQDLTDAATELIADQAKYFAFKVNDVNAVQMKPMVLSTATRNAAYKLRNAVDTYIAGIVATQAGLHSYATGTTPWDVTSANIDTVITSVIRKLDEADIPEEGRYAVVPAWWREKMTLAGLTLLTDNNMVFADGLISRAFGINWYYSNNVSQTTPSTGDHAKILVGIEGQSLSYADAITSIEAFRPEKRFEDAVKGLHVFGAKFMRPDMTLCLHADYTAES